jgi:tetratricopeptide (TPR) repeat protein
MPSAKRTLARRVLGSLFVEFFELGNMAIFRKEYERATTYFSICTEIQPDNAHAYFFLARAHALSGSRNKALDALKFAADKGFAGLQELMGKEFEELQAEKRFKEILEVVKKN